MLKHKGGQNVRKGAYLHLETGSMVNVKQDGLLPGKEEAVYYKVPFVLLFPFGMVLGGIYVVLLPVIGFFTGVSVIGKRVFGGALAQVRKSVSFGWRPTEAYLSGKGNKEAKEKED